MRRIAAAFVLLAVTGAACSSQPSSPGDRPGRSPSNTLAVGDRAPAFTLPSASGRPVSLRSLPGHRPVLLYFSMGPG
jgi:cytochrome oxidase Cu insertion factor (SCO1/SenC/PrrC family)